MLKSLLVALDGTATSDTAKILAVELAKEHSAKAVGLGIANLPSISPPEAVPIGGAAFKVQRDEKDLSDARRTILTFLERFGQQCEKEGVEHEIVEREGAPHEQIALEARSHDLVVIGRDAHFDLKPEKVKHHDPFPQLAKISPCPLIATPPALENGGPILVAYDGSQASARALRMFLLLGLFGERPVHVLTLDSDRSKAESVAASALELLERHERSAEGFPMECNTDHAEAIIAEIEKLRPKMLVLGSFGHGGWREALFGDVTHDLLFKHSCACPVFLCH